MPEKEAAEAPATVGELADSIPAGDSITIVFDGRAYSVTRWPDPPTLAVR